MLKKFCIFYFIIIFILINKSQTCFAYIPTQTIKLPLIQSNDITSQTSTLNDSTLSQDKIWKLKSEVPIKNFPGNDVLWVGLNIENNSSQNLDHILEMTLAHPEQIELYQLQNKELLLKEKTGLNTETNINHTNLSAFPYFKLTLTSGINTYFLKITAKSRIHFKLKLYKENIFWEENIKYLIKNSPYIGAMFFFALFNLLLGLATREFVYCIFALFCSSLALTIMTLNGFITFLPPFLGNNTSLYIYLFANVSEFTGLIFLTNYLNLKTEYPRVNKWIKILSGLTFLPTILSANQFGNPLGYYTGHLNDILISLTCFTAIGTAIYCALKQNQLAKIYLLAWTCMILSVLWYYAALYNLIEDDASGNQISIGANLMMIMMSIGLASKIQSLVLARETAELRASLTEKYKRLSRILMHDVANSLTYIISYTKKIKSISSETAVQDNTIKILKATNNLKDLLQRMRVQEAFSEKLKSQTQLNNTPVQIQEQINESISLFEEQLKAKNLVIVNKVQTLNSVIADASLLQHNVLNNILSNAIKFSPIHKNIYYTFEEQETNFILKIQDEGIGLTLKQLKTFEEKGEIESQNGTLGEKGTGFGLGLAKSAMSSFGGNMQVFSSEQKGTLVQLTFIKAISKSNKLAA